MSFPRRRRDLSRIREMGTITEQTAAITHVGVYSNVRMATSKMTEEYTSKMATSKRLVNGKRFLLYITRYF
ncbi:hypothetical protein NC652_040509 [Populus alba x Populus x berolinensis]|nr:hypothetical protein NC652_040509 [Populus alba x Populus x berolinensis]